MAALVCGNGSKCEVGFVRHCRRCGFCFSDVVALRFPVRTCPSLYVTISLFGEEDEGAESRASLVGGKRCGIEWRKSLHHVELVEFF